MKRGAIPKEYIDKSLNELSANQFIALLNKDRRIIQGLSIWSEKKKRELWIEETVDKIKVSDFIEKIIDLGSTPIVIDWRSEKKKVEQETPMDLLAHKFLNEDFINVLADRVVDRLGKVGGGIITDG